MKTSYDDWKLSSDEEDNMVSQCCGSEYIRDENNFTFCSSCEDDCSITELWRYEEDFIDYYDDLNYEEERLS
tara:strand:- start:1406 stop:1621 length:216 start_codon:yes stop_codon:yes gene_type:complete